MIYQIFQGKVLDFLSKKVASREIAEDLTSEVFEKIWRTINDFQWQGINISAWIFRIARNHLIDYYRKQNKFKNDRSLDEIMNIVESTSPSADFVIEREEEDVQLFNAIKELNEDDQYLIYYKFYEEMSNSKIAEVTGMTETNIGTKLHRIRKKLAKIINSQNNERPK